MSHRLLEEDGGDQRLVQLEFACGANDDTLAGHCAVQPEQPTAICDPTYGCQSASSDRSFFVRARTVQSQNGFTSKY